MRRRICGLIVVIMLLAILPVQLPAAAQEADGWTLYELNLRAGPNHPTVITVLPVNTGLIFEAHNGDMSWLLGHTLDNAYRGWIASGYLSYAPGFYAANLPVSTEIVSPSAPPPGPETDNPDNSAEAPAEPQNAAPAASSSGGVQSNGTIDSLVLIYETDRSEYYELTYWSEGARVKGYMGFPKTQDRRPAIIYNRGGLWDSGALVGREIVPLVETGYVAVATQYRGNAGSEGIESLGHGDVIDVLNLITLLQNHPKVDPWQIGMMGGSRGGMVTYMVLKHEASSGQNRIRTAVTVGGLADLTMWYDHDEDTAEILQVMVGPSPQVAPEQYQTRSAVFWAHLINVPILLMHGGGDWIISPDQSRKLYDAIRASGGEATLLIFEGDDHQLTGQQGGYAEAVRWFNRYFTNSGTVEGNMDAISSAIYALTYR